MKSWMGILEKQTNINYEKAVAVVVKTGRTMYDYEVIYKEDFDRIDKSKVIEAIY